MKRKYMPVIAALLAAAIAVGFTSCSSCGSGEQGSVVIMGTTTAENGDESVTAAPDTTPEESSTAPTDTTEATTTAATTEETASATTTEVPATTTAEVTTKAPVTTTVAATTKAPVTTTAPVTTKAPATTTPAATTTTVPATTTAAPETTAPASGSISSVKTQQTMSTEMRNEMLRLINEARVANGLSKITLDPTANLTAQIRAEELELLYSADHLRPDGRKWSTIYTDYSISYHYIGENIGYGMNTGDTVQLMFDAWMNSPPHKANILSVNFKSAGFGMFTTTDSEGNKYYYWAQEFITYWD